MSDAQETEIKGSKKTALFGDLLKKKDEKRLKKAGPSGKPPTFKKDDHGYHLVPYGGELFKCRFVGSTSKSDRKCTWDDEEHRRGEWEQLKGFEDHCIICPVSYKLMPKETRPGFLIKTDTELQLWEVE